MYQNVIYICISWYNKISWFPVKKFWCQQNSGVVSRDSYIFWIFSKFHHCRVFVTDFREGAFLASPHPWAASKMPILNRIKNFSKFIDKYLCRNFFSNKVAGRRPADLLKMRLRRRCFPVNFPKFFKSTFFIEQLLWLLLIFSLFCCRNL